MWILYWCADFKTPGCKKRQIFKDVEFTPDTSEDPTIEISSPAKFKMHCKTCSTIHNYALSDLEDFQSEESLPLGFEVIGDGFRVNAGNPR